MGSNNKNHAIHSRLHSLRTINDNNIIKLYKIDISNQSVDEQADFRFEILEWGVVAAETPFGTFICNTNKTNYFVPTPFVYN